MSTPTVADSREPLGSYPRSPGSRLGTVELTEAGRERVEWRRARWSAYLRCRPHPQAPLATRLAPILARFLDEGAGDRLPAVPGSLYPGGFRSQVLGHTAWPADAVGLDLDATRGDPLGGLRALLRPDSGGSPAVLAVAASLLNVLSLYPVTVRTLAARAADLGDPALLYEVARAAYNLESDSDKAIRPFQIIAADVHAPRAIRISAVTRLIAHYCRRDRDLTACATWADTARELVAGVPDGFEGRLSASRVYRALALYAMRRRDVADMSVLMRETLDLAAELVPSARTTAERTTAALNERLVLEASLKAFVGSRGRTVVCDPLFAVERAAELDPCDPYTRLISGDALWLLGRDEQALECFEAAGAMGTLPGALAAHRAGTVLRALGRDREAGEWFARTAELDPLEAAGVG